MTLLNLLGIELEPPVAATTHLRFRLSAPSPDPVSIPAGATEVGTVRTASEEAIIFQTDRGLHHPARAADRIRGQARRRGEGCRRRERGRQAEGARPERVRLAARRGRRAVHRLRRPAREHPARGRRGLLPGARRRGRPRGSAAPLGGLGRRAGERLARGGGRRGPAPAASTTAPARSRSSSPPATRLFPSRAIAPTGSAAASTRRRARARRAAPPTSTRPRSTRSRAAPIGAVIPAAHSARIEDEVIGTSDGTPGQSLRAALLPDPRPDRRGVPRGARSRHGRVGAMAAGRVVRREQADRAALRPQRCGRAGRARAGDPDAGRQLAAVRQRAQEGRDAADEPLPPRRRPTGERRGRDADRC